MQQEIGSAPTSDRRDIGDATKASDVGTAPPAALSRRGLVSAGLRIAALGAAAVTAACATLGLPKRGKAEAQYQDRPHMGQHCSGCVHFEAPNRCSVVAGDISPNGWSRYYLPKPA